MQASHAAHPDNRVEDHPRNDPNMRQRLFQDAVVLPDAEQNRNPANAQAPSADSHAERRCQSRC